jgi:uncharacterized protein with HEPN domain
MKRPDDRGRLQDMLESAEEAAEVARGKGREDMDRDRVLNLALARLLEIIGEAAAGPSPEFRRRHPEVPWADIIGLRNRLIHNYRDVDFNILWQIIDVDPPILIIDLKRILAARGKP